MPRFATKSRQAREALARREPYSTYGAMRAVRGASLPSSNRLPREWAERYREDAARGIRYTVLSYSTPIAWVLGITGAVIIPDVKYSITTTGHQGLLYALEQSADSFTVPAVRERQRAAQRREVPDYPVGAPGPTGRGWITHAERTTGDPFERTGLPQPAATDDQAERVAAGILDHIENALAYTEEDFADDLERDVGSGESAIYSEEYLIRKAARGRKAA